ncbi:unnamed protein product [Rhizophagus irregularis]|uniref:Uncharacterized protein n=1 Tax=Rhizophagus irregularis TaxID=588596 RepID=A0A915YYU1_9GLOM|nr:unnamed protein product [Rhizophagus irregularis]
MRKKYQYCLLVISRKINCLAISTMDTSFVNRENIIYEDDLIEQNDISSESEEDTEIYTMKHIQYSMGRPDGQNKTILAILP